MCGHCLASGNDLDAFYSHVCTKNDQNKLDIIHEKFVFKHGTDKVSWP